MQNLKPNNIIITWRILEVLLALTATPLRQTARVAR